MRDRPQLYAEIEIERRRHDKLKAQGSFNWTCADSAPETAKLAVLAEEFGEVAQEICAFIPISETLQLHRRAEREDEHRRALRAELVQVAAVCVAWLEAIEREGYYRGGFPSDELLAGVLAEIRGTG